mgnify:CR=1 FL=1
MRKRAPQPRPLARRARVSRRRQRMRAPLGGGAIMPTQRRASSTLPESVSK